MSNTSKIKFSFFYLFLFFFGGMMLTGCDKPMTYEDACKMKPYTDIKDENDRKWLFEYQMTKSGGLMWLEEELYFLDDDMRYWTTSEGLIELEFKSVGKSFNIEPDKAYKIVQCKGAPQAAKQIMAKARSKVGGTSKPPKQPGLMSAWSEKESRAQRLRQPDLWRRVFLAQNYKYRDEAEDLLKKRKKKEALQYLSLAIEDSVETLGEEDPETQKVLYTYQTLTGRPYPGTSEVTAPPVDETETAAAPQAGAAQPGIAQQAAAQAAGAPPAGGNAQQDLARATELLSQAGTAWRSGDKQKALAIAKQAYQLRHKHLGPDHPQTKEVEKMIRAAQGE